MLPRAGDCDDSDLSRYDSGLVAFLIDRVESAVQRSNFTNVENAASQKVELKGDDREKGEVEVVKNCYLLLKGSY